MPYVPLETSRLTLRRFREADLEPFLTYRNQPEVARYQSWIHWSRDQGIEFIRDQQCVDPGDLGRWFQYAMELKEDRELIGDCGLCVKVAVPKTAEIGFSLAPEHQRKGLATEAVAAVVDYAVRELGIERIVAVVMRDNDRSAALLGRLGLRHGPPERVWFKGQWNEELRFGLAAEKWLARTGP
ncbi:MAG TPA: GNAT family N-acetyltransferase [Thermoanaerobaculia bacterium]|nr:GNAT family N-acetyltransferase [Thermoanaerobaculia bacterium]